MASIKLSTVFVYSSQRYEIYLDDQTTIGGIAHYLSRHEGYVSVSTLELARPVQATQRLQDLDLQQGDRLVMFAHPPQQAALPAPLKAGDKVLRFSVGDVTLHSRGKKTLSIGRPNESQQWMPDIDLRNFVAPRWIESIAQECLRLDFDDYTSSWYARKVGLTRLLIDDFELGSEPIALGENCWLRFYQPNDDPKHPMSRPLAAIHLTLEEVHSTEHVPNFQGGRCRVLVCLGTEKELQHLNVSSSLPVGRVITSLAVYKNTPLPPNFRLYMMRLISPEIRVGTLDFGGNEFLYTTRTLHYMRNVLVLRDVHQREHSYLLVAGADDSEKLIGRRPAPGVEDPSLDVDLFDSIARKSFDAIASMPRNQAWICYRTAENSWWIRLEDRMIVPVFVNNTRITTTASVQLNSGDVLTFGPSVDHYYARLEVEISSRPEP